MNYLVDRCALKAFFVSATRFAKNTNPVNTQFRAIIGMAFNWWADGGPLLDVYWEKLH